MKGKAKCISANLWPRLELRAKLEQGFQTVCSVGEKDACYLSEPGIHPFLRRLLLPLFVLPFLNLLLLSLLILPVCFPHLNPPLPVSISSQSVTLPSHLAALQPRLLFAHTFLAQCIFPSPPPASFPDSSFKPTHKAVKFQSAKFWPAVLPLRAHKTCATGGDITAGQKSKPINYTAQLFP